MKLISMKQRVKAAPSSIFPSSPISPAVHQVMWFGDSYTFSSQLSARLYGNAASCIAAFKRDHAHLMPLPLNRAVPARNGGVNLINLGGPKCKALCDISDIVDHISHTMVITINYVVVSIHINKI